ncbi:hypothetical protein CC1G_05821 [Coprinopsis cinerea okayama7|uniref:Uncharacterized protein n=1 Tax=Coprinopsis cinerea (strain Okayama-7 / 130 / ATCC MYA-4618 / FGSC 9003) TaxID=240176 RepID=A8NLH0_COPC7|nr:hypothetical protein CC1G_05821 [Coprinopsis cinerea okayama7\|eukprot:XP_001834684.1 hypothetical protein CC1G_05821 [Coprinopsis cinerea okayama7\
MRYSESVPALVAVLLLSAQASAATDLDYGSETIARGASALEDLVARDDMLGDILARDADFLEELLIREVIFDHLDARDPIFGAAIAAMKSLVGLGSSIAGAAKTAVGVAKGAAGAAKSSGLTSKSLQKAAAKSISRPKPKNQAPPSNNNNNNNNRPKPAAPPNPAPKPRNRKKKKKNNRRKKRAFEDDWEELVYREVTASLDLDDVAQRDVSNDEVYDILRRAYDNSDDID